MTLIQNTPAWVDARRDFIGSSDLPVLTGNSPYGTSILSLWAIKTRLIEPEPVDPETQEMFDLGHLLEDDIAERYTAKTGRPVRRLRRMLVHKSIPWASASLDRVSAVRGERRIVEVKWVPHRRWYSEGPEPVPSYVQDQVQWQLMVSGYKAADVAVLNGSRVEVYEVEPSASYQNDLLAIAWWFRQLVERGVMPPIDGTEATRQTLMRIHPRDTLDFAPATAELEALVRQERGLGRLRASTKLEHERVRNVLRGALGDHAGAEGEDWRVTFRKNEDHEVVETDWQLVAKAYRALIPEIDEAELDALVSLHSSTQVNEGTRPLVVRVKDEETGKWT